MTLSRGIGAALALTVFANCSELDCCGPPPTGSLRVTTSTTGANLDPDGYTVVTRPQIAGRDSLSRPIGIDTTIIWDVEPATHTVRLSDVASNCATAGDNPRSATVPVGDTVATTFAVNCT